ncbi:hypothetical protein [Blautia obeum]|uniref:hypothetical protein n=1 Tax=Blautia obeum TaxID=40520 RepID=UPI00319E89DE
MNINQIAHDLAVAKSVKDGSDTKEIIKLYHEYNEKFLNVLSKEPIKLAKANAIKPPHI